MRRLILASVLTTALSGVALMAQSTPAPKAADSKAPAATSTGKVHKHSKKGSKTGKTTTAASKKAAAPAK